MKLSIIIPVYNEQKTIFEILKKVCESKLPKGLLREIIVVDDGSIDKSALIINGAILKLNTHSLKLFKHKKNQGKGAAVRTGLRQARGDIILIQDADLEYDPNDYSRLLNPILSNKANVVYGTRLKNYPLRLYGKKTTPLITHYLGNKFLTFVTNIFYGNKVTDMETCYKIFRKEVIRNIKIYADKFDFEPEITAKILKKGYKIYEVPIRVHPRGYDEGKKITWKDGFIALWTLIKYRFID